MALERYQNVMELREVPAQDQFRIIEALIEYLGVEIVQEATPDYTGYFIRLDLSRAGNLGPMSMAAARRPLNYSRLDVKAQWAIDRRLGILDWDGDPNK